MRRGSELEETRASGNGAALAIGDLVIDTRQRLVVVGGTETALTPTEFRILETLASAPGRVFSRADLLDRIDTESSDTGERSLDSHIAHLRAKLNRCHGAGRAIVTVYGFGYKLERPPR